MSKYNSLDGPGGAVESFEYSEVLALSQCSPTGTSNPVWGTEHRKDLLPLVVDEYGIGGDTL